ncbi:MAG: DUF3320 domain-containing protein, partial [Gammaproteobacteria bacterium]|nr:DUF3320 domain-containing protein [Gammaproteobacteria bacterium]
MYLRGLLEDLISGRKQMELSSFEQLPDGMNGFFDEGMERLGVVGKSQELKALLLTLAWTKGNIPLQTLAELSLDGFGSRQDTVASWQEKLDGGIGRAMQFLMEDYLDDGTPCYRLYHEGLREYYHAKEELADDMQAALSGIADRLFDWQDLTGFTRAYSLQFCADHLLELKETEKMWINMKDEVFRQAQVEELHNYYQVMDGLQRGIRLYSEENLKRPNSEWTGRLCWLMLRYGEASALAQIELDLAWQWAREGQMGDALERLMFVSEAQFYRAAVYLLWQESQRMKADLGEEAQPWSSQQTAAYTTNAQLILDAVEDRVPAGVETADWSDFTDPDFMALWGIEVSLIPDIQLEQMLARSYDVDRAKLIDHWGQRLLKLGSGSVSQDVEETDQLAYATEIRPYQLAELEMDLAGQQLHQLAVEELAAQVEEVVAVESPVHLQSVCRRICEAVGIGRVGNRIREAVETAAGWAEEQDWLYRQGDFLWHGEMVEIPIRD